MTTALCGEFIRNTNTIHQLLSESAEFYRRYDKNSLAYFSLGHGVLSKSSSGENQGEHRGVPLKDLSTSVNLCLATCSLRDDYSSRTGRTGRTGPDRTGPDQTGPDRTDRTGPDRTGPSRIMAKQTPQYFARRSYRLRYCAARKRKKTPSA